MADAPDSEAPSSYDGRWSVNGEECTAHADIRSSLLDLLRDELGLTGTKKGCDRGECGACTVHIDGRSALACLMPAVMAQGAAITTIEGIDGDLSLRALQQAFIDQDALQCGYCTPGQIMSGLACIAAGHADSLERVTAWMSGNLCRCAAYPQIRAAVMAAAAV